MVAFVTSFTAATVTRPSAFNGTQLSARHATVTKARVSMAQTSPAVPFLPCPSKLDGSMAGDVGFDPLGFSDYFDVNFLREAELKHCKFTLLNQNVICLYIYHLVFTYVSNYFNCIFI